MKNLKLYIQIAWDWINDYWWFAITLAIVTLANVGYWISEDTGETITAYFIGIMLMMMAIVGIRYLYWKIVISRKIKKLNRALKRDYLEKKQLIDERNKRLMAKYLNGEPITVIDKKTGNVVILQQGKKMIISTMN